MELASDVLIGQDLMGLQIESVDMTHVNQIKYKLLQAVAKHANKDLLLKQLILISKDSVLILVRTTG
jgi:hypothetical protein